MFTGNRYPLILLSIYLLTFGTSCKKDVAGCTDPLANNYNPEATIDDGSCFLGGCTDPTALNYNPASNQNDNSCIYAGCTDGEALNFDPVASVEDGSCRFVRDPFLGLYDCDEQCEEGNFAWQMLLLVPINGKGNEVLLNNLGDFGLEFNGTIMGNSLVFDTENNNIRLRGTGTLQNDTLTINYTLEQVLTDSILNQCEIIAIKN